MRPSIARRRTPVAVGTFPALDLHLLPLRCCIDFFQRNVEFIENRGVDGDRSITRNRSHSQLFQSRYSEFSHHQDIQGKIQRTRNFIRYRYTPARQPEDDSILPIAG